MKKGAPIKEFHETLQALDIPKMLCAELAVPQRPRHYGIDGLRASSSSTRPLR
ncbi:hypothetical protein ACOJBO_38780 [Rhizobium beringeri]